MKDFRKRFYYDKNILEFLGITKKKNNNIIKNYHYQIKYFEILEISDILSLKDKILKNINEKEISKLYFGRDKKDKINQHDFSEKIENFNQLFENFYQLLLNRNNISIIVIKIPKIIEEIKNNQKFLVAFFSDDSETKNLSNIIIKYDNLLNEVTKDFEKFNKFLNRKNLKDLLSIKGDDFRFYREDYNLKDFSDIKSIYNIVYPKYPIKDNPFFNCLNFPIISINDENQIYSYDNPIKFNIGPLYYNYCPKTIDLLIISLVNKKLFSSIKIINIII